MFSLFSFLEPDIIMEIIKKATVDSAAPANLITSIRAVANLFKSSGYHSWLQKHRSEVSLTKIWFILNSQYQ